MSNHKENKHHEKHHRGHHKHDYHTNYYKHSCHEHHGNCCNSNGKKLCSFTNIALVINLVTSIILLVNYKHNKHD